MGGDHAPSAILKGCWEASALLDASDLIHLIGDQTLIRQALSESGLSDDAKSRFNIVHTTEVIAMDESPVDAIRSKPDSSIAVMCKMAAKGEADVVISAGNTGACVADADIEGRRPTGHCRYLTHVSRTGGDLRRRRQSRTQAQAS